MNLQIEKIKIKKKNYIILNDLTFNDNPIISIDDNNVTIKLNDDISCFKLGSKLTIDEYLKIFLKLKQANMLIKEYEETKSMGYGKINFSLD